MTELKFNSFIFMLVFGLVACSDQFKLAHSLATGDPASPDGSTTGGDPALTPQLPGTDQQPPTNRPVSPPNGVPPICDPFGGPPISPDNGLVGSLTYIPAQHATYSMRASQFFPGQPNVVEVPNPVYLSQLNVPDRSFTEGFPILGGDFLKTLTGEKLIEFFQLRLKGQFYLGSGDSNGDYEYSLYTDDGSFLNLESSPGNWVENIANDFTHPVSLGCSKEKVELEKNVPLNVDIIYFQAPRVRIAAQWFYRKYNPTPEPYCGGTITDFGAFAARGWKLVAPANLVLPPETPANPCYDVPQ